MAKQEHRFVTPEMVARSDHAIRRIRANDNAALAVWDVLSDEHLRPEEALTRIRDIYRVWDSEFPVTALDLDDPRHDANVLGFDGDPMSVWRRK